MARRVGGILGGASVVGMLGVSLALAGSTVPNEGDDFVGKAGALRYATDSSISGGAAAGCGPRTRRLIGGGGVASGPAGESYLRSMSFLDLSIEPPEPNPDPDTDPDDGWGVAGETPPGSFPMISTAICRKGGKLRYRRKEVDTGPDQLATVKLGCGKGGGWQVTTGAAHTSQIDGFLNSSHPFDGKDRDHVPDDGWRVRILRGAGAVPIEVYAICARNVDLRYERSKPVTIPDGNPVPQSRARNVGCGKKRHAVGGGPKLTGLINRARVVQSSPTDSGDPDNVPDDRWRSRATNIGGVAIKMTAFGICLR